MAATSKEELEKLTRKDFAKLVETLGPVDPQSALLKDDEDTSIKDVVAHRAHWIDLFLGWHADGVAGRDVHMPAKGYKWSELKAYNAELREKQRDLGWDDSLARLDAAHGKLIRFIESTTDAALYGRPMTGGNGNWTAGRYAEAAGPSHYRSARKYVRARLRMLSA